MGKLKGERQTRKTSKISKNIEEFANRSSLHGIKYIHDKSISYGDRLLWLLLFLGSASFAILTLCSSYNTWQANQVMTTLKTLNSPVADLNFPAITICGSGQHMGLVEKVLYNNFRKWQNLQKNESGVNNTMGEDFTLYMKDVFQIKNKGTNIIDILRTMTAPSAEASDANIVRENQLACAGSNRRKRNTPGNL